MTDLVSPLEIEDIVGEKRQKDIHLGRAVSDEATFYILHSQDCLQSQEDLRDCEYSHALDNGLIGHVAEDETLIIWINQGRIGSDIFS